MKKKLLIVGITLKNFDHFEINIGLKNVKLFEYFTQ